MTQLVTFRLGGALYGVDVTQVQEVLHQQQRTRVPLAPRTVAGLVNLRGQVVLAVDLRARLALTRGEIALLAGEAVAAEDLLGQAIDGFERADDPCGCSDAHLLAASLAHEHGRCEARDAAFLRAADLARLGGDALRERICRVTYAVFDDYARFGHRERRWEALIAGCEAGTDPCLRRIALEYRLLIQGNSGDFLRALHFAREALDLAVGTGHHRQAALHRTNIAITLWKLQEHDAALEVLHDAVARIRASGWPVMLGIALQASARVLVDVGRLSEARRLAEEAHACATCFPDGFNVALTQHTLGDIELAEGRHEFALGHFERALAHGRRTRAPALEMRSLIMVAEALLRLDRADEAACAAEASLALARETDGRLSAYESLRILAEIHHRLGTPAPAGSPWPEARLHYLQEALAAIGDIQGVASPPDLLERLAQAHAQRGDLRAAYRHAQAAIDARARLYAQRAARNVVAFEIRRENDRIRAQAAHEAMLGQAHREHAQALAQHGETLQRLAAVGREITAHLDAGRLFDALPRHARALMDTGSFCLRLLSEDGRCLAGVVGREDGEPSSPHDVRLDDPTSAVAACARTRRPCVEAWSAQGPGPAATSGPCPGDTMHAPLLSDDRLLGTLSVQAHADQACGERELAILRSLAGFLSVALENARACAQLRRLPRVARPSPSIAEPR